MDILIPIRLNFVTFLFAISNSFLFINIPKIPKLVKSITAASIIYSTKYIFKILKLPMSYQIYRICFKQIWHINLKTICGSTMLIN